MRVRPFLRRGAYRRGGKIVALAIGVALYCTACGDSASRDASGAASAAPLNPALPPEDAPPEEPPVDRGSGGADGEGSVNPPLLAPNTDPEDGAGGVSNPAEPSTEEVLPPVADAGADTTPVRLFLAGDSIMQTYRDTESEQDQAGWGQMLGLHAGTLVSVVNHAIGGRTARRFIDEARLDAILDQIAAADYLLVQFGTNDGNRTATYELGAQTIPYFLDPQTDFKVYLDRYIDAARERGAIPVLVTPTPRNSAYCTGGNGTGAHAAAMRELGAARGVSVVDLNAATVEHLRAICPAPTPEDFFLLRADGTVDGTHFQENGARILASFVAAGLRQAEPRLRDRLR